MARKKGKNTGRPAQPLPKEGSSGYASLNEEKMERQPFRPDKVTYDHLADNHSQPSRSSAEYRSLGPGGIRRAPVSSGYAELGPREEPAYASKRPEGTPVVADRPPPVKGYPPVGRVKSQYSKKLEGFNFDQLKDESSTVLAEWEAALKSNDRNRIARAEVRKDNLVLELLTRGLEKDEPKARELCFKTIKHLDKTRSKLASTSWNPFRKKKDREAAKKDQEPYKGALASRISQRNEMVRAMNDEIQQYIDNASPELASKIQRRAAIIDTYNRSIKLLMKGVDVGSETLKGCDAQQVVQRAALRSLEFSKTPEMEKWYRGIDTKKAKEQVKKGQENSVKPDAFNIAMQIESAFRAGGRRLRKFKDKLLGNKLESIDDPLLESAVALGSNRNLHQYPEYSRSPVINEGYESVVLDGVNPAKNSFSSGGIGSSLYTAVMPTVGGDYQSVAPIISEEPSAVSGLVIPTVSDTAPAPSVIGRGMYDQGGNFHPAAELSGSSQPAMEGGYEVRYPAAEEGYISIGGTDSPSEPAVEFFDEDEYKEKFIRCSQLVEAASANLLEAHRSGYPDEIKTLATEAAEKVEEAAGLMFEIATMPGLDSERREKAERAAASFHTESEHFKTLASNVVSEVPLPTSTKLSDVLKPFELGGVSNPLYGSWGEMERNPLAERGISNPLYGSEGGQHAVSSPRPDGPYANPTVKPRLDGYAHPTVAPSLPDREARDKHSVRPSSTGETHQYENVLPGVDEPSVVGDGLPAENSTLSGVASEHGYENEDPTASGSMESDGKPESVVSFKGAPTGTYSPSGLRAIMEADPTVRTFKATEVDTDGSLSVLMEGSSGPSKGNRKGNAQFKVTPTEDGEGFSVIPNSISVLDRNRDKMCINKAVAYGLIGAYTRVDDRPFEREIVFSATGEDVGRLQSVVAAHLKSKKFQRERLLAVGKEDQIVIRNREGKDHYYDFKSERFTIDPFDFSAYKASKKGQKEVAKFEKEVEKYQGGKSSIVDDRKPKARSRLALRQNAAQRSLEKRLKKIEKGRERFENAMGDNSSIQIKEMSETPDQGAATLEVNGRSRLDTSKPLSDEYNTQTFDEAMVRIADRYANGVGSEDVTKLQRDKEGMPIQGPNEGLVMRKQSYENNKALRSKTYIEASLSNSNGQEWMRFTDVEKVKVKGDRKWSNFGLKERLGTEFKPKRTSTANDRQRVATEGLLTALEATVPGTDLKIKETSPAMTKAALTSLQKIHDKFPHLLEDRNIQIGTKWVVSKKKGKGLELSDTPPANIAGNTIDFKVEKDAPSTPAIGERVSNGEAETPRSGRDEPSDSSTRFRTRMK